VGIVFFDSAMLMMIKFILTMMWWATTLTTGVEINLERRVAMAVAMPPATQY
jgi:hypothetical protein